MTKDTNEFTIGRDVSCSDGPCGELRRVVIDPIDRALTHLVVQPAHRRETGRLVPVALVDSTEPTILLRCTIAEFDALEDAEETHFVPGARGAWGYGQDQMFSMPYYGLGMNWIGPGGMGGTGTYATPQPVTYDRIPLGDVEVVRGEHVHATDGDIGRVQGLVIDPGDHHVTHVLLDEGHLWGHKRVAIPIMSVADVKDGVRLKLTKDEVRDLPSVELDHQH
jgi:sporulation protein YlmC with PRC-barrel domain